MKQPKSFNPLGARYKIAKNPSYLNSVFVATRTAVLYAPTTLLATMRGPVGGLMQITGLTVLAAWSWVFGTFMLLFFGLCGYLNIVEDEAGKD